MGVNAHFATSIWCRHTPSGRRRGGGVFPPRLMGGRALLPDGSGPRSTAQPSQQHPQPEPRVRLHIISKFHQNRALLKSTYGICLRLTLDGDDSTHMCLYGDGSSSFYGADLRNGLHAREWQQQQATTPTQLESESLSPPRVVDVQPAPLLPPLFSFLLSCLAFYLMFFLFSPFFSEGLSAFCSLVSPHSVPFYTHSCRTKSVSSVC